jgi:hypothetical protein
MAPVARRVFELLQALGNRWLRWRRRRGCRLLGDDVVQVFSADDDVWSGATGRAECVDKSLARGVFGNHHLVREARRACGGRVAGRCLHDAAAPFGGQKQDENLSIGGHPSVRIRAVVAATRLKARAIPGFQHPPGFMSAFLTLVLDGFSGRVPKYPVWQLMSEG